MINKEEEKEDKLKHNSLFTVFVMCCTFVHEANTFYHPLLHTGYLTQPSQPLIVKTKLAKCKIFQLKHKKTALLVSKQCKILYTVLSQDNFCLEFALSSVKFIDLKLRLCKNWQLWGMPCSGVVVSCTFVLRTKEKFVIRVQLQQVTCSHLPDINPLEKSTKILFLSRNLLCVRRFEF